MCIAVYNPTIWGNETLRQIKRQVLSSINGALEQRAIFYVNAVSSEKRLGYLYSGLGSSIIENQQFWNILKYDLTTKENALSSVFRAALISLALWVERETK